MHRARRATRSESLCGITVLQRVSGRAFCAVTTLPPPEQAAAEFREQLAGHQATEQPGSRRQQPEAANAPQTAPLQSPSMPAIPNWCDTGLHGREGSHHDAPEIVVRHQQTSAAFGVSSRWRPCCTQQSTAPPAAQRGDCRGSHRLTPPGGGALLLRLLLSVWGPQ